MKMNLVPMNLVKYASKNFCIIVHVHISFKTFLNVHVRAGLDVDISVFPCHCPTLNNEIMNYRGSSDVSWTGLGLGVKQGREA